MPVLVGARSEPGCRMPREQGHGCLATKVVTAMPRAGRTHGGDVDTSRHEWYESACSGRAASAVAALDRPWGRRPRAERSVHHRRGGDRQDARDTWDSTLSSVAAGVVGQLMRVGMWTWEDRGWR